MSTWLTLVRHGTTEWMEQGLTHGRLDSPLSALGISQAQRAAEALHGQQFDAFYSSPTGRAWQTAQIISTAVDIKPEPLDLLLEQDFGALEGTKFHKTPRPLLVVRMLFGWLFPFGEGGETLRAVYHRGVDALDLMAGQHPGGKVLVVSHTGLINAMLKKISGHRFTYFYISPASITEIELNGSGGKILTAVKTSFRPKATIT